MKRAKQGAPTDPRVRPIGLRGWQAHALGFGTQTRCIGSEACPALGPEAGPEHQCRASISERAFFAERRWFYLILKTPSPALSPRQSRRRRSCKWANPACSPGDRSPATAGTRRTRVNFGRTAAKLQVRVAGRVPRGSCRGLIPDQRRGDRLLHGTGVDSAAQMQSPAQLDAIS